MNDQSIARLVERNGLPLTAAQKQAEEQRVDNAIDQALHERLKPIDVDETLGGLILARAGFRNERRILVNGRPAIALQIVPHDTTGSHSSMDYVAEHLRGEIWIDEQDNAILRMEAAAPSNIVFFDSLIAPKGFPISCYRARRLEDGVYIPEAWCGTRLPSVFAAQKDSVGQWNRRVQRTEYRLEGCRIFRANAHIVPSDLP